jgi:hypothetical protein
MGLEAIVLAERARIDQQLDPLARGELALLVLSIDTLLPTAELGLGTELVKTLELLLEGQRYYSF